MAMTIFFNFCLATGVIGILAAVCRIPFWLAASERAAESATSLEELPERGRRAA
jgi:hypothetical protein